ncbi:prolipoprotein diacylglyceryl transferase [Actinomadura sp. CNU-125]|uniref:prolipoprotein diacylglyceryl transferase n=1 Tax=Actinomadura sp. CNU-125 TaxID=1904961 RepID=UPI0009F8C12D|nr:prolipoprotein diacylglyceryl transferase [Actinomadura sp. CNU-125]
MAEQGVNAPVLEIYEDFQCPACRAMEEQLGATVKELAAKGEVKVVYRPFQLFQQDPLMSNSRRAANAAACAPAGKWVAYHDKLFTHQPPEGDEGFAQDELIKWAAEVGITGQQFETCVRKMQKIEEVENATVAAGRAGVDATPYLALNGRKLGGDALTEEGLRDAIAGAQGSTPSPSGSASGGTCGQRGGLRPRRAGSGGAATLGVARHVRAPEAVTSTPMQPLAFIPSPSQGVWHLGPVPIRAYAIMIILGIVVAVWLGERRWAAKGGQPGTVIDVAVWAVPFGLVGGRLYHVLTDYQRYFGADGDPLRALEIWEGGLGIWGAVALGAVGAAIGCRTRGVSPFAMADAVAPGIALAQAIGRWGNYWNQELYGRPLDTFWALEIDRDNRPRLADGVTLDPEYADIATYHPTFLYESLWCLGVAILVIWAGRRFKLTHGRAFALYVAAYTVGRFWIELLRIDDAHHVLGMRLNNWTSIAVFLAAVAYMYLARNRTGPENVGASPDDDGPKADPEKRPDDAPEKSEKAEKAEKAEEPEKPDVPKGAEPEAEQAKDAEPETDEPADGEPETGASEDTTPADDAPEPATPEDDEPATGKAEAEDDEPEAATPEDDEPAEARSVKDGK